MRIEEVLPALRAGKKIRRATFMSKLVFVLRNKNEVAVACDYGKEGGLAYANFYLNLWSADLLADDWEVVQ